MGKIAHKFGLKYGHAGLIYPYRAEGGYVIDDIHISRSSTQIFDFLGYNFSEFNKGFTTQEDIFDYLINSTHFDSEIFQFDNLNAIDKKRNRKRPSYNKFLEYIQHTQLTNILNWKKDKILYLTHIDKAFPESNLVERYFELIVKEKELKKIKEKFNGKIIMNLFPELAGKELGSIMSKFRHGMPNFDEWVLNTDREMVINTFINFKKDLDLKKL